MDGPIATIDYTYDGRHHRAILLRNYRWLVTTDTAMTDSLNTLFPTDTSPALGVPGHLAANQAALWLRGTVRFTPRKPAPTGVEY